MTNLNTNDLIKGWDRNTIASKIADDLPHSSYVNLGIGMPELVSQYIKEDREIIYHSENGLLGYKGKTCIHQRSFVETLTEPHFKQFINICLSVLSTLDCPVKRGTFIEYRNGMINVSPIGRACNQAEREEFEQYDNKHKVRENMIVKIQKKWIEYITSNNIQGLPEIKFSIGGQISVDVFPKGWDKTYCLQFVEEEYDEIHFFGDKTHKGGNDYEIFTDSRVIGHKVEEYRDTIEILNRLFN